MEKTTKKTLYLECYSGISADMTVGALLDLGADKAVLKNALKNLPVNGYEIKISQVSKSGLAACDFDVILDSEHENHDHDMDYLYGDSHNHDCKANHHEHKHDDINHTHESQSHFHCHENSEHNHSHTIKTSDKQSSDTFEDKEHVHTHHHTHRNLSDILNIIDNSKITARAKELAIRIFTILAKAEAKAHGIDEQKVHFHEVGAVDSIIDVVAVAVCLDNLNITDVIVPVLYEGQGFIRCQHGMIPIPVPAVSNIAADNNLHLHFNGLEGEFVTPTGAAIVAAIKTCDKLPEHFSIDKIGIGAGKRTYERPSILRAMLITDCDQISGENNSMKNSQSSLQTLESSISKDTNLETTISRTATLNGTQLETNSAYKYSDNTDLSCDFIYKLESNIDDCTGENLGFIIDRLLDSGARDVYYTPIYMKKNRPAYQLNVICTAKTAAKLEDIIFKNTTTIGIRKIQMERSILKRQIQKIQTSLGEVQVKICQLPSGEERIYPEYDSIIKICTEKNMSYIDVYQTLTKEF